MTVAGAAAFNSTATWLVKTPPGMENCGGAARGPEGLGAGLGADFGAEVYRPDCAGTGLECPPVRMGCERDWEESGRCATLEMKKTTTAASTATSASRAKMT